MEEKMAIEYEFYNFAKQRFDHVYNQLSTLGLLQVGASNEPDIPLCDP